MTAEDIFSVMLCWTLVSYMLAFAAGMLFEEVGKGFSGIGLRAHDLLFWASCLGCLVGFFVFYMFAFAALNVMTATYLEEAISSVIMIFEIISAFFLSFVTCIFVGRFGRQYHLDLEEIDDD